MVAMQSVVGLDQNEFDRWISDELNDTKTQDHRRGEREKILTMASTSGSRSARYC